MMTRAGLRSFIRGLKWPAIVVLALNIENLAAKFGLDKILADYSDPAMDNILAFVRSGWAQIPALLVLGAAVALWVDARLRGRQNADGVSLVESGHQSHQRADFGDGDESNTAKSTNEENERHAFLSARHGDAHERLELFILDLVAPACWAQIELQQGVLQTKCDDETLSHFINQGLRRDYMHSEFWEAYETVSALGGSPLPELPNDKMIDCIVTLENGNYRKFCEQAGKLAKELGIDYQQHPTVRPLWEEWRISHNALVEEYDKLKRESRFGPPLYRPQKESRWGGIVDPMPSKPF